MDDLLKEAIADAKAVRETALENAKIALEEAFTPRLQSMLSKKIQSEMEVEDEEAYGEDDEDPSDEFSEQEPEDVIAAQDEVPGDEDVEEQDDEMGDEEEMDMEGVIEINGVKYAPVVSEEDESDMGEEEPVAEEDEDELDLEAILRELEEEDEEEEPVQEQDVPGEEEEVDDLTSVTADNDSTDTLDTSKVGGAENSAPSPEASDSSDVGQGSEEPAAASSSPEGEENDDDEVVDDLTEEEDIDLEEVIKALSEEEDEEEEANEVAKIKADLDEHRNVVKYLRSKLNEVNLLNAKLLFTNKLFRSFGLSNDQKMKVVENFDRAHNLREVKLVYSTLAESFGTKTTKQEIKEHKGSASKAVASTKSEKQEIIAEGSELRDRFKKLAGII